MQPLPAPNAEPSRRIPWRRKVVYLLASLTAAAVVAEAGLRAFDFEIFRFVYAARQLHCYARWNFVDLRPGKKETLALTRADGSDYLRFTVTTDGLGCRCSDPDGADPPPPVAGEKVIHCIGDSFTMGWGVEDGQSYPAVLGRRLGRAYRVVNLGVDGFGLVAAAEKSRRVGQTIRPDVLLYLFCPNDFTDDVATRQTQERAGPVHMALEALDYARRHSYLVNAPFAAKWALLYRQALEAPSSVAGETIAPPPEQAATELRRRAATVPPADNATTAELERLAEQCRRDGVRLQVVVRDDAPESLSLIRFCDHHGIATVLCPLTAPQFHIPDDGHLNERGNRALAEFLAKTLRSTLPF